MLSGRGGGGGGGFGGFPYRSSHQQGQDGRGGGRGGRRNNNRGRGRQSKKSSPVSYYSDLQPLPNQRKLLVGNGSTIKWLRESTKSSIFIPKKTQQQHPVRVNTSELSNLLHTFHEISYILSQTCDIDDTATTYITCNVKIRSNNNNSQSNNNPQTLDVKVNGQLLLTLRSLQLVIKKIAKSNRFFLEDQ